jgi:acyl-CoA reductase-like NAD-dependent aldehyde dehydrogenase
MPSTPPSAATPWPERAAALHFDTRPVIGDGPLTVHAVRHFDTVDPSRNHTLATFPDADAACVDRAVRQARQAFGSWRRTAPDRRKALLLAWTVLVRREADTLALMNSLEMGKPIGAARAELAAGADLLQFYAELADKIYGELTPTDSGHLLAMTQREPRGVVGVITPWNFPVNTALCALAPALAAGNTVVLKPSEVSPSSALRLARLALEAGLPPGVLNVVPGRGATAGAALARHADVDKLHFTGSTAVGRRLMVDAGESNGKPVMLETGGKSAQIVFDSAAGLPGLGEALAQAAFTNSGQLCVARTRLLVQAGALDRVLDALHAATATAYVAGDPLDEAVNFGPLCSRTQAERVRGYLGLAADDGATLQPLPIDGRPLPGSQYVPPTLVLAARPGMRIAQEEVFGPVLCVLPFRDEAEAVALANGVPYGLAATAWTTDLGQARRLARDLDAGRVDIRMSGAPGASLAALTAEPFGGSGHGPLGGLRGLDPYLRSKGIQFITG